MKALEQNISPETSFIIHDNERTHISQRIQSNIKNRILEHVRNGTDVILVTSAKHRSEPISVERYFSDNNEEVRTICLNNASFASQSGSQVIDLSMISAVVYESIHLDTHFAIIVDDADEFPIEALNELIRLALGINTSKNNVNFIFSGSPNLLSIVERISDIKRLSLAHCSLDTITEHDIQEFIHLKQSNTEGEVLQFNKYALKKISTLASGSLHKASIILEWTRLYSRHTGNTKITSGFIDELIKTQEGNNLLSSYPPQEYEFSSTSDAVNKENIEFTKPQPSSGEVKADGSNSKTIYIESKASKHDDSRIKSTVYEKVMNEEVEPKTQPDHNNDSFTSPSAAATIGTEVTQEPEYEDTYRIDALEHINDPLPYADEDLPLNSATPRSATNIPSPPNHNDKAVKYLIALVVILFAGYFAWSNQLINKDYLKDLFPTRSAPVKEDTQEKQTHDEPALHNQEDKEPESNGTLESNNTIEALVDLANKQIEDKKLTTPKGDNAFETFKLILEFQPDNQHAHDGIEKIKTRYETWAKLDINDGKIKRAKYFLSRAIEISPDNDQAKQLLARLEQTNPIQN